MAFDIYIRLKEKVLE